jgi:dienelactone hydrolase
LSEDAEAPFEPAPGTLALHVERSEKRRGATLRDVSYACDGARVTAWCVVPEGDGPWAGLLWGHWGFGSRDSFLAEALALAASGVASLLPNAPGYGGRRGARPPFRAAAPAAAYGRQSVRELRRGLDVLAGEPGVDARRLGFVGHSLGASVGALLAAADERVRAAVLAGGTGRISRLWLPRASEAEREALAALDGVAWIGRASSAFLLQYGERDEFIARADAEALAAAAAGPAQTRWYACDHAFDLAARRERAVWLAEWLGLGGIDGAALAAAALPARDRFAYRLMQPLLRLQARFARRP